MNETTSVDNDSDGSATLDRMTRTEVQTITGEEEAEEEDADNDDDDDDDSEDEDKLECRICRESDGQLISPCRCNTVVHAACLQKWVGYRADALFPLLSSSIRNACEICRAPIDSKVRQSWQSSASSLSMWRLIGRRVWNFAFTVETCLFLFLFVLAVMGHALFVMGVFKGISNNGYDDDEHSHKRIALAFANAVVTFALLICVQKIVVRWLREADANVTVGRSNGNVVVDVGHSGISSATAIVSDHRYASRCTTLAQLVLGAFLSIVAAAEIFLLIRALPLGGLA